MFTGSSASLQSAVVMTEMGLDGMVQENGHKGASTAQDTEGHRVGTGMR